MLKEITECLERGETVKFSSFGTFVVRKKGQRLGRNPKTGTQVPISPRRVIPFKASAILKQRIKASSGHRCRCPLRRAKISSPELSRSRLKFIPLKGIAGSLAVVSRVTGGELALAIGLHYR